MQNSRSRNSRQGFSRTPVATAIVVALASSAALAQEKAAIEEVVVTATKRTETMQEVPISIQALGGEALTEMNLQNFKDYTQMLPTVAVTPTLGAGSSFSLVYMRGVASGGDGQATTSLPSVGMYLDELSITTIQGNLDVHMYDIERVEALAGPQGTLFGASSQAGTIRIISKKPDLEGFSAGYGVQGTMVDEDDTGYLLEGYVNIPMGDKTAIRLVGWSRKDPGWIDNVLGSRTFPGVASTTADDITVPNDAYAKENYNTIETTGGRAALRIDLNDNWTITPTVMAQKAEGKGSWGDDLSDLVVSGNNDVMHANQEFTDDKWYMAGLTIEGRIGNFDLTYSGSYLDRQVDGSFDYSDYSYWYDTIYTTGYYADLHFSDTGLRTVPNQFVPDQFDPTEVGTRIMPGARFTNDDGYTKENHEIRITSPQDNRVRGLIGFFWQEQVHDFQQHWRIEGLGTAVLMNEGNDPRFADTVYLNSMDRVDTDQAVFADISFDINDSWTVSAGARHFEPEVTVKGFFGFGLGFTPIWSSNGENRCDLFPNGQEDYKDKPCLNVDKGLKETGQVYRLNVSWNVSDSNMVYATWSEGYRPGGINRDPNAGEYKSDFLTNYEFGWKTQWLDDTLQFNGAVFQDSWDNFQVSFTGANAITAVNNGPTAEVLGLEAQFLWLPTDNLRITSSLAFYDTELQDDYCPGCNDDGSSWAPAGTKLPVTADFKGNIVARYDFTMFNFDSYAQGLVAYEGERSSDMEVAANDIRGDVPAYTVVDLAAGIRRNSWAVDLFIRNAFNEDAPLYLTGQCTAETCGAQNYGVRMRPRTIGIKFSQNFE